MIHLVTAVPGSGKTCWIVSEILRLQKEGRVVYANVNGLLVDNVLDSPDDWRDTPDGSVVIYDECQEIFPSNAKPGVVSDDRLTSMERHRHTGHDLYFITQAPSFVHHHIRKLTGRHIHMYRPNGISGCNIYTWNFAVDSPNDRREQERADHITWKFPKENFALYKSATVHTHKFRFPRKIMIALCVLVAGFGGVAYSLSDGLAVTQIGQTLIEKGGPQAGVAPGPLIVPYSWSSTAAATPVAGCMASVVHCQCYSEELVTIAMSDAQCRSTIGRPLPRRLLKSSGRASGDSSPASPPPPPPSAPI